MKDNAKIITFWSPGLCRCHPAVLFSNFLLQELSHQIAQCCQTDCQPGWLQKDVNKRSEAVQRQKNEAAGKATVTSVTGAHTNQSNPKANHTRFYILKRLLILKNKECYTEISLQNILKMKCASPEVENTSTQQHSGTLLTWKSCLPPQAPRHTWWPLKIKIKVLEF